MGPLIFTVQDKINGFWDKTWNSNYSHASVSFVKNKKKVIIIESYSYNYRTRKPVGSHNIVRINRTNAKIVYFSLTSS